MARFKALDDQTNRLLALAELYPSKLLEDHSTVVAMTTANTASMVMMISAMVIKPTPVSSIWSVTIIERSAMFTINATSGALSFLAAPDYETPADAGGNRPAPPPCATI